MASIPLVAIRSTSDGQGQRKENLSAFSILPDVASHVSVRFNPEVREQIAPMQPVNPCGFRAIEIILRI